MVVAFTFAQGLAMVGSGVPAHLTSELEVPILTGVQAQGDLLVFPTEAPQAYVQVPQGQAALLIHTEENGANGVGPGTYAINRKREADAEYRQRLLED